MPCIVRDLNDDAAFDLLISENLQRSDIRPSEEGVAFKRIIDKGKDIRYISARFGKSETFIHNRLALVRLIPEITDLLDCETISIGMAFEISRFEPTIQEHIYREHLTSDVPINNWKNFSLKVFKEKLEDTYTVLMSRFSFDKSECEQCPRNSEFYSLFPMPENSRCTNSSCLVKKQENHMVDLILSAIGDENLDVSLKNGGGLHTEIVDRLGELGVEVKTGHVYPMPEDPVMPLEKDFSGNQAEYEQANADFLAKETKWNSLHRLIYDGIAQKVVVIENLDRND
jgi:ParB family chromosome partitioning protein